MLLAVPLSLRTSLVLAALMSLLPAILAGWLFRKTELATTHHEIQDALTQPLPLDPGLLIDLVAAPAMLWESKVALIALNAQTASTPADSARASLPDRQQMMRALRPHLPADGPVTALAWFSAAGEEFLRVQRTPGERSAWRATVTPQSPDMFVGELLVAQGSSSTWRDALRSDLAPLRREGALVKPVRVVQQVLVGTFPEEGLPAGILSAELSLNDLFDGLRTLGESGVAQMLINARGDLLFDSGRPNPNLLLNTAAPPNLASEAPEVWASILPHVAGRASFRSSESWLALERLPIQLTHGGAPLIRVSMFPPTRLAALERSVMRQSLMVAATIGGCVFAGLVAMFAGLRRNRALAMKLTSQIERTQTALTHKDEFLARISHDLRTPLTSILGMTELLQRGRLGQNEPERLASIAEAGAELEQLIEDILDASKLELAEVRLRQAPFKLGQTLDKVVNTFRPAAEAKRLRLTLTCDPAVAALGVLGDATRLGQILSNLISNAIKYTRSGGVRVEVKQTTRTAAQCELKFSVSDTGMGIPEHLRDAVLRPFERGVNTDNFEIAGSGLGLAITGHLLRLMESDLVLESELDQGSTFSFQLTLPITNESDQALSAPSDNRTARILIVHPDSITADTVANMLSALDVESSRLSDMDAARREFGVAQQEGRPYRAVFVDAALVESNGLSALIRELQAQAAPGTPDLWVVLNDSHGEEVEGRVLPGLHSGTGAGQNAASGYEILTLPLSMSSLVDCLRHHRLLNETIAYRVSAERQRVEQALIERLRTERPPRILFVDDNRHNREVMQQIVNSLGLPIELASSGRESLERLRDERFDMVFMDLQMPGMDGIETTRRIRERHSRSELPVIALSASLSRRKAVNPAIPEMNDELAKPIDLTRLMGTILHFWRHTPTAVRDRAPSPHDAQRQETGSVAEPTRGHHASMADNSDLTARLRHQPHFDLDVSVLAQKGAHGLTNEVAEFVARYRARIANADALLGQSSREKKRFARHLKVDAEQIGAVQLRAMAQLTEQDLVMDPETDLIALITVLEETLLVLEHRELAPISPSTGHGAAVQADVRPARPTADDV